MYAHRGVHSSDADENTVGAFRRAAKKLGGFECDVRLSKDGVPVVIHDATLLRTHGHRARVSDLRAARLSKIGVPLLRDVLPFSEEARVILDLKVQPVKLIDKICRLCARLGLSTDPLIFLVWEDFVPLPGWPPNLALYRARDYRFGTGDGTWTGIACKYSGTHINHVSIRRALEAGLHVNLYAPDKSKYPQMKRMYGRVCSITRDVICS